jgi:pilus assembly protein Flp/PilA
MKTLIQKFWRDEDGLSAVEYAVAGALIVVGLVGAFTNLGNAVLARINQLVTALS